MSTFLIYLFITSLAFNIVNRIFSDFMLSRYLFEEMIVYFMDHRTKREVD